jgi:hypothetical protein
MLVNQGLGSYRIGRFAGAAPIDIWPRPGGEPHGGLLW